MNNSEKLEQCLLSNGYPPVEFVYYEPSFGCLPWGGYYVYFNDGSEYFLGKNMEQSIENIKNKNLTPAEEK